MNRSPDAAYCWRHGVWLPGSQQGDGDGYGDGGGSGNGSGNGWIDGYGYGDGGGYGYGDGNGNGWGDGYDGPLPLCADALTCACRQAGTDL